MKYYVLLEDNTFKLIVIFCLKLCWIIGLKKIKKIKSPNVLDNQEFLNPMYIKSQCIKD